jgi:hypothetical protein
MPPLTDDEAMVIDSLEAESVHIDDLARKLTLPTGRLSGLLLQLELKGLVAQSPGKRFCLDPPGTATGNSHGHEAGQWAHAKVNRCDLYFAWPSNIANENEEVSSEQTPGGRGITHQGRTIKKYLGKRLQCGRNRGTHQGPARQRPGH